MPHHHDLCTSYRYINTESLAVWLLEIITFSSKPVTKTLRSAVTYQYVTQEPFRSCSLSFLSNVFPGRDGLRLSFVSYTGHVPVIGTEALSRLEVQLCGLCYSWWLQFFGKTCRTNDLQLMRFAWEDDNSTLMGHF